ncbi:MAG TPA: SGNH/GDSL hydrolase family protein [Verrucomicrobium sp.]|nr:SGNH/GDSL hydrolase family protein [Verrucomicrobium sp.]
MKIRSLFTALFLAVLIPGLSAREPAAVSQLPANARVALIGDSITEQKLYSRYIEAYLLACTGRSDIKVFQFGWSGETAGGFSQRAVNDLSVFKPTVATLCYGMNDGRYVPYTDAIGADYEKNMRLVLTRLQELGVKNVVVGSPGAVDTKFFVKISPDAYNDNLAHLRDIDQKLAAESKYAFANVHDNMISVMAKAKAALGADYDVCGRDGVHPGANGHLLMAQSFLKGLGVTGDIGEITVDLKGAGAVTGGHKIASGTGGSLELESTTWPFCFDGNPVGSGSTRSILPYSSFNDDLNRLVLKVKNLDGAKAKVTWGTETKEFTKDQLTQGVNLAAEFSKTPFDGPFMGLLNAVGAKQSYETPMIKGLITNFRNFASDIKEDAEFAAAIETLKKKMLVKQEKLDAEVRTKLVPVKHTLKVEAVRQ